MRFWDWFSNEAGSMETVSPGLRPSLTSTIVPSERPRDTTRQSNEPSGFRTAT